MANNGNALQLFLERVHADPVLAPNAALNDTDTGKYFNSTQRNLFEKKETLDNKLKELWEVICH